jgi:hypothetical protein
MLRPSSRRSGGLAIAASLAAGLAGCSLALSLDSLTGGDAGGGPGGSGDDAAMAPDVTVTDTGSVDAPVMADGAGVDVVDETAPTEAGPDAHEKEDASSDASKPDAATKPDAGKSDAATVGYCASLSPAPDFCDDFDEGAANPAWDQVTSLGGAVAVDAAESVSAPDSMVSTVDANQAEGSVDLAGYKSLTSKQGVAGTATLDFEIRIDAGDISSAADAVLGAIQLYDGNALYDLELEVSYASASTYAVSLTEDSPSVPHATGATLALGAWTHVTLSVVLPAGNGGATTATMTIDGSSTLSTTVHVLSGGHAIANPIPEALVGPTFATPAAGGWSVRYDNVTFDVE